MRRCQGLGQPVGQLSDRRVSSPGTCRGRSPRWSCSRGTSRRALPARVASKATRRLRFGCRLHSPSPIPCALWVGHTGASPPPGRTFRSALVSPARQPKDSDSGHASHGRSRSRRGVSCCGRRRLAGHRDSRFFRASLVRYHHLCQGVLDPEDKVGLRVAPSHTVPVSCLRWSSGPGGAARNLQEPAGSSARLRC
jgi:hypothetical protein